MSAAMVSVKCQRCGDPFMARVADRKRGWGKFCSKSCKAIKQTQRTGYAGPEGQDAHYRREYGGIPQYDRRGNYEGFRMTPGDLAMGGYNNRDEDAGDPFGDGKW